MSDKRQQISLKLDAELAQALREMKQGHDESLAEVVVRLLRKAVRQSPAGARGAPAGRSNPKLGTGRGAIVGGRRGKPMASAGRAGFGVTASGKPWGPAPGAGAIEGGKRSRAAVSAPPRGSRRIAGKALRSQPLEGSSEPRRRNVRPGTAGPRAMGSSDALGSAEDRLQQPRQVRGRRSNGR